MKLLVASRMSRRRLLRSTGAGLLLAPFVPLLDADRVARAAGAPAPKRLIFFYSSNGMVRERWLPTMSNGELVLSEILQPLSAHKSNLLVVDGLAYTSAEKGEKDGHYGGMNAALTGSRPKIIDKTEGTSVATSISIDQKVGAAFSAKAPLKFTSLECGVQVDSYSPSVACLSYTGPQQPIYPQNDPYKIWTRVFDGLVPPAKVAAGPDQRTLDRKSIIDLVRTDLAALAPKLSATEKAKVDAHLEGVRALEKTLQTGSGAAATDACRVVDKGAAIDVRKNDSIPLIGKLQMEILLGAMACDLTRVGTIQHGRAGAQHRFSWLGPEFLTDPDNGPNDGTSGIHGLAHNEAIPASRAKIAKCHAWYAGQVAALVDRLKAIPEGDGTMADNTLVVWMNEMGTGNHSLKNTPWVLVGSAGGFFKTGRVLSFPGQPHNKLLVAIGQSMGLPDTTFGDPEFGNGALPGLSG